MVTSAAPAMIASLTTSRPAPDSSGKPCSGLPNGGTQHSGVVIRNDRVTNDITNEDHNSGQEGLWPGGSDLARRVLARRVRLCSWFLGQEGQTWPGGSDLARRVRLCSWFLDGDEEPKTNSDPETASSSGPAGSGLGTSRRSHNSFRNIE